MPTTNMVPTGKAKPHCSLYTRGATAVMGLLAREGGLGERLSANVWQRCGRARLCRTVNKRPETEAR